MGEKIEGVLKPLLASSRPFVNPLELSEIFCKKSDDPVRLSVGEGTNHNGLGLENWHSLYPGRKPSHSWRGEWCEAFNSLQKEWGQSLVLSNGVTSFGAPSLQEKKMAPY